MSEYILTVKVTVIVSGGSGSAVFDLTGEVNHMRVVTPSNLETFDIEILSIDGSGVFGSPGHTGDSSILNIGALCVRTNTLHIFNAVDGTYTVTIVAKQMGLLA